MQIAAASCKKGHAFAVALELPTCYVWLTSLMCIVSLALETTWKFKSGKDFSLSCWKMLLLRTIQFFIMKNIGSMLQSFNFQGNLETQVIWNFPVYKYCPGQISVTKVISKWEYFPVFLEAYTNQFDCLWKG